ncbi:hypothetical protein [Streptomyces sp. NPDC004065]|uniref:hypothetical protein n=1 Tax=Streptomyces sp. NPDC004065 TaxID=3364689 RepID=UPI003850BEC5
MTDHDERAAKGCERARSEEEPGAHSGGESLPRDRTVPGTASAKEGYQPERGTSAGDPLEGLESEDATRSRSAPEAAEADPREGDPANGT